MASDEKSAQASDSLEPVSEARQGGAPGLVVPNVTWYKHAGLRRLTLLFPFCFLRISHNTIKHTFSYSARTSSVHKNQTDISTASTTTGYDGSLLNGLQTMKPWQAYFDNPQGSRLGLFTAIMNIGAMSALLFSSYLADLLGRRMGVAIGVIILFVGTILQSVPTVNESMFLAGRFFVGLGANISQGSAPLLVMEIAHPQHRGKLTTMYNTLWYVGSIISAWTVYGTVEYNGDKSWRIPVALQALMPLVMVVGIWFLPESPRWLCSKDRLDEAFQVLVKYHASGDSNDPFVQAEFTEIQETIRLEKENSHDSWLVLVQTPGNRKRLLLITLTAFFSQCSGNGLVSYYLHDILNSVGIESSKDQSLINGGLQIWSLLVAIGFSVFLVDKFGRKTLFMIAGVGMLLSFSIWTGCSAVYAKTGNTGAGGAVIGMIFLFYGVAGFAWPGLTVAYCAEILPYHIRAKGLAYNLAMVSLSSVFNQYVNPIGLDELQWRYYFVYIAILVIECLCIWFLFVETKGPTLEEIAEIFDGDDANVAHIKVLEDKAVSGGAATHLE